MGAHDCSEMGSLGCPEQWVARAVLLKPPGPFFGLGLLEMCAVWRNPIPHPPASSAGWQSQSQRRLRPPGASCTPLCRDTMHSPPACWSLAWVVSPGATAPTVTYSVPNTPTPVQNGDPPSPRQTRRLHRRLHPELRGHARTPRGLWSTVCCCRRDASDGHAGATGGDVGRPPAPPHGWKEPAAGGL